MKPMIANSQYDNKEYWETRYETEASYEWFAGYCVFRKIMLQSLSKSDKILMLGCGNSTLSEDMHADGFLDITSVDYSATVIEKMQEKCRHFAGLKWLVMDVRDLKLDSHSFDVVIEKATLDALLASEKDPWNISDEGEATVACVLNEVSRVLRPDGRFLSISFAQPHFRKPLYARTRWQWSVDVRTFGNTFHYFFYTMLKGGSLSDDDIAREKTRQRRKEEVSRPSDIVTYRSDSDDEDYLMKNIQCFE